MCNKEEVLNFIKRFQNEGTIKTFTEGCCYWFAFILDDRFNYDVPESGIMYNPIENHFATWINGKLYDITGEIPFTNVWEEWFQYEGKDKLESERIIRDCIEF